MVAKFKALIATALIAVSFSAQAGVILTRGGEVVANASHIETFESGTSGSNITNQFASNGLTFQTLGDAGITLTSNSVCNNMSGGMSGKYLSMGQRYPCTSNTTLNAVSMLFDGGVSELSWTGFNRTIGEGFRIEILNDGNIVGTDVFNSSNNFANEIISITGGVFDEIRFFENSVWQGFFGIDNMAWNMAPVVIDPPASDVPEPGIALLFGVGMIGMGFMRKKKSA